MCGGERRARWKARLNESEEKDELTSSESGAVRVAVQREQAGRDVEGCEKGRERESARVQHVHGVACERVCVRG